MGFEARISPLSELFLFEVSRAQHVQDIIKPALNKGKIVICDRFTDSSTAYQGYGRGLDLKTVRDINLKATQGLTPDLTVLTRCSSGKWPSRRKWRNKTRFTPKTGFSSAYSRWLFKIS